MEERVLCRVTLCVGGVSSECTGVWLDFRFKVLVGIDLGTGLGAGAGLGGALGAGSGVSSGVVFFFAGRPLLAAGFRAGFGAGAGAGASSSSCMGSGCTVFTLLDPRVK